MTPIFYDPRQNVADLETFSPSAGKPARFVALMTPEEPETGPPRVIQPVQPVTREDLYRVHDAVYVDAVFAGKEPNGFGNRDLRVPPACLWTIGSLLAASRWVLKHERGIACSPSSGFHHAGYGWGAGYCTFNGLMVVAAVLLQERPDLRIGILDCDFHFGDGTADILAKKPALAASIMHRTSGQHFHDGDDPDEFFLWLEESIAEMNEAECDLVLYQAGADMHIKDPLGGLLDDAQMRQRDRIVFRKLKAGIAWNLAGGYRGSSNLSNDPTLRTHRMTLLEADNASGR